MEHFAFPGNIDFAADDQGAFWCVYSSSVKQSLPSVNHEQFPMQMTHKYNKWLQILAQEDFPPKLLLLSPSPFLAGDFGKRGKGNGAMKNEDKYK